MSETLWEELTRSPLDPDPNEEPWRLPPLVPIVVAGLIGLAIGLFALGEISIDPTTTVAVTQPVSSTVADPEPADPIVPAGYVDIDGVGVRAIAAYARAGNLYIVVNEAVRSDKNPAETSAFHGSQWFLEGDGVTVTADRAIKSDLAPGMQVIEFSNVTQLPDSDPVLLVRRGSEMVVRTGCQGCGASSAHESSGEVVLDGLERPYALNEALLIDVGGAITLSIDRLEVTDEWGYLEWHVIDENEARIRPDLRVIFEGTDDPAFDGVNPTQLIPENLFGASQQNPTAANPQSFTRQGALMLDRVGELISDENLPTSLLLHWTVEWQHPVGEPITIPLDGVADLGIID